MSFDDIAALDTAERGNSATTHDARAIHGDSQAVAGCAAVWPSWDRCLTSLFLPWLGGYTVLCDEVVW